MSSSLFFIRCKKERERKQGRGTGGRALTIREFSWCDALAIVINMLRCIRYRDRVPPSGVVGRTPALAILYDLAPSCLFF